MIARFTLVQVATAQDGHPSVVPWQPASYEQPGLDTAHTILGVTMTASDYEEPVAVMRRGYMRAVTEQGGESWAVGDLLWAASDGSITKTRPAAPLPLVLVGVIFADEGTGGPFTVAVDVRVLPSLGELSGVSVETPADKDVLIYKASTHVWEPRQLDHGADLTGLGDDDHTDYLNATRHAAIDAADHGSGAATDGQVLTADGAGGAAWEAPAGGGALDDLTDVNVPSPLDGQGLVYDSSSGEWIAGDVGAGAVTLDDLTDVNAPAPQDGQVLAYDASSAEWIAADVGGGAAHASSHENGGDDEISVEGLSGELADAQKVTVRKNSSGAGVGTRPRLNLIEGSNVTLTVADDGTDDEVDITIAADTGGEGFTDSQKITADGNWTKPAGAIYVRVVCIGGGGGGGGGGTNTAGSTTRSGGAGGGGGAQNEKVFLASDLPATVACTIGGGGGGGAGAPGPGAADGSDGSAGGTTSFGTYLSAYGGGGGYRGQDAGVQSMGGGGGGRAETGKTGGASTGYGGRPGVPTATYDGVIAVSGGTGGSSYPAAGSGFVGAAEYGGAAGAAVTNAAVPANGGSSLFGGGGGGGGGGYVSSVGKEPSPGGASGTCTSGLGGAAGANGSPGTAGTAGSAGSSLKEGDGGGGGGAGAASNQAGGDGGDGGAPGGGGGGGGAGALTSAGGAGGDGARGEIRVYSWG